jgi:two-component system CheB/CheR fusion protein
MTFKCGKWSIDSALFIHTSKWNIMTTHKKSTRPPPSDKSNELTKAFPIIGIGASAGGLAAFESFFSGMTQSTEMNMAFVLVQHLAPNHKSLLADLVQHYTSMPVLEVVSGIEVQPNCTYIIPPNYDMELIEGKLQLIRPTAPHGQRMPVNFFFRSLARDLHDRSA